MAPVPGEPLRATEAARRLDLPTKELLRLLHDRRIRCVMVEGIAHVPEEALDDYRSSGGSQASWCKGSPAPRSKLHIDVHDADRGLRHDRLGRVRQSLDFLACVLPSTAVGRVAWFAASNA